MCKLLLQASVDNCPEVRCLMAAFCRAADNSLRPTPGCLSRCVASAVFSAVPERLPIVGLALAEVLQEEESGEVSVFCGVEMLPLLHQPGGLFNRGVTSLG